MPRKIEKGRPVSRKLREYGLFKAPKNPERAIWIARSVVPSMGQVMLKEAFREQPYVNLKLHNFGYLALSLVNSQELNGVKESSPVASFIKHERLVEEIASISPQLLGRPVEADVIRLLQYGKHAPRIGVEVFYPALDAERELLTSFLSGFYDSNYEWPGVYPRITIAEGKVTDRNLTQLEETLPDSLLLGPISIIKDIRSTK